jgi:hypothetical protein
MACFASIPVIHNPVECAIGIVILLAWAGGRWFRQGEAAAAAREQEKLCQRASRRPEAEVNEVFKTLPGQGK